MEGEKIGQKKYGNFLYAYCRTSVLQSQPKHNLLFNVVAKQPVHACMLWKRRTCRGKNLVVLE